MDPDIRPVSRAPYRFTLTVNASATLNDSFDKLETLYPTTEQKLEILAKVQSVPGHERYTMKQLNARLARRRQVLKAVQETKENDSSREEESVMLSELDSKAGLTAAVDTPKNVVSMVESQPLLSAQTRKRKALGDVKTNAPASKRASMANDADSDTLPASKLATLKILVENSSQITSTLLNTWAGLFNVSNDGIVAAVRSLNMDVKITLATSQPDDFEPIEPCTKSSKTGELKLNSPLVNDLDLDTLLIQAIQETVVQHRCNPLPPRSPPKSLQEMVDRCAPYEFQIVNFVDGMVGGVEKGWNGL